MGAMFQGFSGRRHIAGTTRLGRLAAAVVVLVPGIASAQTTYTGTGSYAWGDVSATGTTTFNVPSSGTLSLTGSNAGFGAQTQIGKIGQGTLVLSQPGPAAWSGSRACAACGRSSSTSPMGPRWKPPWSGCWRSRVASMC